MKKYHILNQNILFIIFGLTIIILYLYVQHGPIFFTDTKSYYALGEKIFSLFSHEENLGSISLTGKILSPSDLAIAEKLATTGAGARSPYYSFFLYFLTIKGTIWTYVAIQSILTLQIMFIYLRRVGYCVNFLSVLVLLPSSFATVVIFVMPDIFAAIGLMSAIVLITRFRDLSRFEIFFSILAIFSATAFHSTNSLVLFSLCILAIVLRTFVEQRFIFLVGITIVIGSTLAGGGMLAAYPKLVKLIRHETIYAPPFLTARFFADGPERRYLQTVCAANERVYAMCRFRDEEVADNNDFLWNKQKFYQMADYDVRVSIIHDDFRLAFATGLADPLGMAEVALVSTERLMFRAGVGEVFRTLDEIYSRQDMRIFSVIDPQKGHCFADPVNCYPKISITLQDMIFGTIAVISIFIMIFLLLFRRLSPSMHAPVILLLSSLIINALICGSFSGPSERYQSRLIWLVPITLAALISRRRAAKDNEEARSY